MSHAQDFYAISSKLVDHTSEDWATLHSEAEVLSGWAGDFVRIFQDTLNSIDETKKVFHEGEQQRLEKIIQDWFKSLNGGDAGEKFWDHQWFIGLLHVQRKVRNLYMVTMMGRIQLEFHRKVTAQYDAEKASELYEAFHRITTIVAAIIAESFDTVVEISISEGLAKVGMNKGLLDRIQGMQIKKMLEEARS